ALRLAFVAQALCVALPLVTVSSIGLAVSSFVVGAFVPGCVAITIGRTRELIPGDPARQAAAWGFCTTAFALGQAISGYAFSFIFCADGERLPNPLPVRRCGAAVGPCPRFCRRAHHAASSSSRMIGGPSIL